MVIQLHVLEIFTKTLLKKKKNQQKNNNNKQQQHSKPKPSTGWHEVMKTGTVKNKYGVISAWFDGLSE